MSGQSAASPMNRHAFRRYGEHEGPPAGCQGRPPGLAFM